MSSYYYKTKDSTVLAAVLAWDAKLAAFHAMREKMADVFGGPGSPMYSGSDNYVGGVKISQSHDLDPHWCRPDQYGYRDLRSNAKPVKGATKEARAAYKAEHERLRALWNEHCPARISKDEVWKAVGICWGSVFMGGGIFFEFEGAVYFHLGFQLKPGSDQVEGAVEILSSEFETVRQAVNAASKAA
jgi:hypothetical protein